MKTDLSKILSISGQHGLFRYLGQSRNGAIVESLADGHRTMFGMKSRISTLADISIYTKDGELRLKELFLKMKDVLGDEDAPSPKADAQSLKDFFGKAVPDYDGDRFYVSHMKKVVDWYNDLKANASLDFTEEGGEEGEADGEGEAQSADPANE